MEVTRTVSFLWHVRINVDVSLNGNANSYGLTPRLVAGLGENKYGRQSYQRRSVSAGPICEKESLESRAER